MGNQPTVSIVLAVYNGEKYIKETIESILAQSFGDFELIIVNDCSTDNSVEAIQSFSDPRIILLQNDENRKLAYSLNKGISIARGKYVARIDSDDLMMPDRLELQVSYLDNHPEIDVLGGAYQATGSADYIIRYPVNHSEISAGLFFENTICHPAVMMRKSAITEWYDETYVASQDYDLWVRLIENHQFHNLKNVIIRYRIHQGQTRNVIGNKQKQCAQNARERYWNKTGLPSEIIEKCLHFCENYQIGSYAQFKKNSMTVLHACDNVERINTRHFQYFAKKNIWQHLLASDDIMIDKRIVWFCFAHFSSVFLKDPKLLYLVIKRIAGKR